MVTYVAVDYQKKSFRQGLCPLVQCSASPFNGNWPFVLKKTKKTHCFLQDTTNEINKNLLYAGG